MIAWNSKDVGAAIRDARRQHGWTQATLADHVGASRQWVIALEQGKRSAEIGKVINVLKVLGFVLNIQPTPSDDGAVDLDRLLNDQDQP